MDINATKGNYVPKNSYLVCIDSDGCAFDTMEIKHKECFCPATIENWGLQAISKYAREAWEYVNLYSKTRGINRFNALIDVLDLLSERKEVKARNFQMPDYSSLRNWVKTAPILNNDELAKLVDDPIMARTLEWSYDINRRVAKMVHDVPPFPFVRESLERLSKIADIVIVSATPREALLKEWHEHRLNQYVALLGAQEDGSKKEIIAHIKSHYDPNKSIMIGDAPGDYEASSANGILFYPICPNDEENSWQEFYNTVIDLFEGEVYADDEMKKRLNYFDKCLPSTPPWTNP